MLTPADPAFDGPVILFQDVVKVLHRSMSAVLLQCTFDFELRNRRRITGVLVGVDDPRRRTRSALIGGRPSPWPETAATVSLFRSRGLVRCRARHC